MKVDSDAVRPFEYADPRSLSRAWFDALHARRPQPRATQIVASAPHALASDAQARRAHVQTASAGVSSSIMSGRAVIATKNPACAASAGELNPLRTPVRRTQALEVQAEPETGELNPRLDVACSTTDGALLRLLLEHDAGRISVVAVCEERVATRMTDVLERARIALAARGVAITTRLITPR